MRRDWAIGLTLALGLLVGGGILARSLWSPALEDVHALPAPVTVARAAEPPAAPAEPGDAPPPPLDEERRSDSPNSPIDLVDLRRRLPQNLYWELGVKTTDPEVLARRAAEEKKWTAVHGKVLAGEASDEDLHAYFERQRQLHQDYLDFSRQVLEQYGDRLSERDRGLFELGARMHADHLTELPREEAEALAHKQAQDRRRADWEAQGKPVPPATP